ncbi:hypothetical protein DFH28DRAFT_894436 [Melampsora americana]|nr:hypothetical protein DFH28DRAFT_894436 [Melampsora americana]
MPWKHGTEPLEHIFGWMRVISPNFTVLDARQMIPKIHAVVKSLASGMLNFEGSEHIHSGYKCAFGNEKVPNTNLLLHFPSNKEITFELEAAKKYAMSLAAFVAMHDDPVGDNSDPCLNLTSCDARDYDVIYQYPPGETPEESGMQAAAQLVSEQQKTDVFLSNVTEEIEEEILSNGAMSLFNLLNPSNEQNPAQTVNAQLNEQPIKALVFNDQDGAHLVNTCLLDIRRTNDSQVQKHRGNERARMNVDQLRNNPGGKLNPSECSKLVAVVMKSKEVTPTGVSRIHRWNIAVKLDLAQQIRNTSTFRDLPSHAILTGGGISQHNPLEYGKFVVIIKNNVSTPYCLSISNSPVEIFIYKQLSSPATLPWKDFKCLCL